MNLGFLFAVALSSGALHIDVDDTASGFAVRLIENRLLDGGACFVNSPGAGHDMWRLDFIGQVGADGRRKVANSRSRLRAKRRTSERNGDSLKLKWLGMDLPGETGVLDVTVEIRLVEGGAASEWNLLVDNRSSAWALERTHFPCLPGVMKPGEGDVLEPAKPLGGQLHRAYAGGERLRWTKFPSSAPPMCAFMHGGAGLYIGVHDSSRPITQFLFGPGLNFEVATPVENAGVVGKAARGPAFPVLVRPFLGDWWQAARIYREWAMRQKWAAKGPIAERADFPQAMKDLDVCAILVDANAAAASNKIARIVCTFPGLNVGVHWYQWHNSGFCVNFPELFPAKKGVPDVMRAWAKEGVMVMPYTNPRLWDVHQASWEFSRDHACRNANGGYDTIDYLRNDCAVMCPSSDTWKRSVWKWSRQVLAETGANAVYYDQVAVARPFECYDGRHGHTLGGGRWWTDGYRKMLEPMHDMFSSRNAPITSELSGDQWLDLIDGYLLCGSPHDDEVPLMPAVYSGYAIYFGSEENMCDPEDTFESWQFRQFTWGVLPGWFDRWDIGDPKFARQQGIIARLARIRRAAEEFMVYGSLVDEVRFLNEPPVREYAMKYLWRPKEWIDKVHMSDLHGMVWRSRSGKSCAAFVANATAGARRVRFRVPCGGLKSVEMPETAGVSYSEIDGVGELELPPHGIAYLRAEMGKEGRR